MMSHLFLLFLKLFITTYGFIAIKIKKIKIFTYICSFLIIYIPIICLVYKLVLYRKNIMV